MNYYEILKISKDADENEIKNAYKKLVKKYHPDLFVADKEFAEKKIKEINEAYDVLSDAEARVEYNQYNSNFTYDYYYYDEELQKKFNQFYNSLMNEYMNIFGET